MSSIEFNMISGVWLRLWCDYTECYCATKKYRLSLHSMGLAVAAHMGCEFMTDGIEGNRIISDHAPCGHTIKGGQGCVPLARRKTLLEDLGKIFASYLTL